MTNKLFIRITLLCLAILSASLIPVYAQEPGEEEESPPVTAPSARLDLTFEQLGYDTRRLDQGRPALYYRVDLPGNFQIAPAGNYLDLITYHLPEIPYKPSALKVVVNGELLSILPLTGDNAVFNVARVNLPQDLLHAGRNYIEIDLETITTCEDPDTIIDVFVDQASTLSFGYQQNTYPTDLSFYPFPFVERSLLRAPVTLVLPDHPTSNDLTAAATVAAGLGQMSGGAIDLTAALVSDLAPNVQNSHHLIVIGRPGDNALLDGLELPLPIDETTIEPGQGVLEEIVSPWNTFRLILVVSGLDDEGMLKASNALNRQAHFLGMRGPVAVVTLLSAAPESVDPRAPSMTLASLGYEDQIVYGARPQNYTFDFTLPLGWQLESLPFFVLKFAHADILDPYASAIDVALNGVPIGSTLLDESNSEAGELTASLPWHLLKTGRNRLQVRIEMNFPAASRDKCIDLDNTRAWTVISSESEVFLPYNAIDLPPDLSLLPYPFGQSSGFDQTLLVLPDQPSSQTINALMQLAVLLGSPSQTEYISAHVAYASEVDEEIRENRHLILLGRPTENELLRAADAYLPHPFVSDSDILEPLVVDSVAFVPDPERSAGLLEIGASPWSKKHSLLAITGTTDEGVHLAVQTLLEQLDDLKGNLAIVEPTFLSGEPSQVSTYAIDTRPPATMSGGASAIGAASESNLVLLAERWWK